MSAGTLRELLQSDYLNYGFVSLHASDAIQSLMEGKPLSSRNRESLSDARHFLETVANGVDLVTSGEAQGHDLDAVDSVGALGIAIDPLERIQKTLASPGAAGLIRSLAEALETCANQVADVSTDVKHQLQSAKVLFDAIYARIARELDQHPVFGGSDEERSGWLK
jgi:hypothetical protein